MEDMGESRLRKGKLIEANEKGLLKEGLEKVLRNAFESGYSVAFSTSALVIT